MNICNRVACERGVCVCDNVVCWNLCWSLCVGELMMCECEKRCLRVCVCVCVRVCACMCV